MQIKPLLMDLPVPILTPRLRLEPPKPGDGDSINQAVLSNISNIAAWMPWANPTPTREQSEEFARRAQAEFMERKVITFLIWDRFGGGLLGSTGLHNIQWNVPKFETGYWVRREAIGQGFITEAVNAVTRYAFSQLSAKRLAIHCDRENKRSRKIPESLGFAIDGILRNDDWQMGGSRLRDTVIYSRIDALGLPDLDVRW